MAPFKEMFSESLVLNFEGWT